MNELISMTPDELASSAGPRLLAKCHALIRHPWQNPDVADVPDLVDREDTLASVLMEQLPRISPRLYRGLFSNHGTGPWPIHEMVRLITASDGAEYVLDRWCHVADVYRTRRIVESRRA